MTATERCPICEGGLRPTKVRAYDRLVTGDGPFGVVECAACEYGITVPQLSGDELAPYYADTYYESYYEHSGGRRGLLQRLRGLLRGLGAARRQARAPYRLDGIRPGKVLEVGCGSGELLGHFATQGWKTYGIDPSGAAVAAAGKRGAEVHEGTLSDQPWPRGEFQLVVFQHSLEHIPDPVEALREAVGMLAPGGTMIVDVPNWKSWQRHLFGGRWAMLDMPRHLQHFSPRALTRLAEQLDLRPLEVGTNSNAISTAYSVHYLIAGRWTPGWKLWLSYAVSLPLLPLVLLGDRFGGGDACYAVMARPS